MVERSPQRLARSRVCRVVRCVSRAGPPGDAKRGRGPKPIAGTPALPSAARTGLGSG